MFGIDEGLTQRAQLAIDALGLKEDPSQQIDYLELGLPNQAMRLKNSHGQEVAYRIGRTMAEARFLALIDVLTGTSARA